MKLNVPFLCFNSNFKMKEKRKIEFFYERTLHETSKGLTELNIPSCSDNEIITSIYCAANKIKEIDIPNTVYRLYCHLNQIKELNLPNSLRGLMCDYNVKLNNLNLNKTKVMFFF